MIAGLDRPLAPFGRRTAAIRSVKRFGPYVVLTAQDDVGPRPRAGQFYMLQTAERWGGGTDGRPYLPRALSFARVTAVAGSLELDFLLEVVGPGTERLAACETGEALLVAGPFGNGFEPSDGAALLVAGGIGLAPIVALADELGEAADVMVGVRSSAHTEAIGHYLGDTVAIATEDGSAGAHGYVTELLSPRLSAAVTPTVYACGPPAMLEAVRALAGELDADSQLALESGMACGYGACFGCVVPAREGYVRLCVDGPVLRGSDIETALIPGTGHAQVVAS